MDDKQIELHREFLKDSLRQTINFRFFRSKPRRPCPTSTKTTGGRTTVD